MRYLKFILKVVIILITIGIIAGAVELILDPNPIIPPIPDIENPE
jgi:hypothetical protein